MKKYTKEELAELAQGVFKDDKESPAIYADENGTFRNSAQYEKLKADGEHKAFKFEFKNPNVKDSTTDDSEKDAQIEALKAEKTALQDELKKLKADKKPAEKKAPKT